MKLFYGMGGGFGHLTRIKRFIQQKQISAPFKVITSNPKSAEFFHPNELIQIEADQRTSREQLAEEMNRQVASLIIDDFYVDTFPCGILGELPLVSFPADRKHYLARRLLWKNYANLATVPMSFATTFRFEQLEPDHQKFVERTSQKLEEILLTYSSVAQGGPPILSKKKGPFWLIQHTSVEEELQLLIDHACEIASIEEVAPSFIVLSDLTLADRYPNMLFFRDQNPMEWYPHVDKVFTAAGFNSWYQLKAFREKHICLPFKRRFDDQFWRARLG